MGLERTGRNEDGVGKNGEGLGGERERERKMGGKVWGRVEIRGREGWVGRKEEG